jgi:flagellar hook protein FlgE
MSLSSLFSIGISGLKAFASGLQSISSNIANSQTAGYKRVRTEFADLLPAASGGVRAVAQQLIAEQGALARTGAATNLAIAGDGFFVVAERASGDGAPLFTRAGDFAIDALGNLKSGAGYYLQGAAIAGGAPGAGSLQSLETVNINRTPPGADPAALGAVAAVAVDPDGLVRVTYANGETHALYRIPLALFANSDGLAEAARTAFRATSESGDARLAAARAGSAGAIEGSAVEISTVDIGQEFSALIATQRAYSTNARLLTTADALWRTLVETAA